MLPHLQLVMVDITILRISPLPFFCLKLAYKNWGGGGGGGGGHICRDSTVFGRSGLSLLIEYTDSTMNVSGLSLLKQSTDSLIWQEFFFFFWGGGGGGGGREEGWVEASRLPPPN